MLVINSNDIEKSKNIQLITVKKRCTVNYFYSNNGITKYDSVYFKITRFSLRLEKLLTI